MRIYDRVCIALTNKCTAACEMCCYECSPQKDSHLTYEVVSDLIDQIEMIGGINDINITGGEPFLYYDELKQIISKATQEGFNVTCLTNSFWCDEYEYVIKRLKELKALGLKEIYTSMDVFHREYISPNKVANLLKASKEIGLACGLNILCVKSRNQELFSILEELGDAIFNVKVSVFPLNVVGKQEELIQKNDVADEVSISQLKCKFNRVLLINYDGDVYPCCSNYIKAIPCLKVGNIYEASIKDIVHSVTKKFPFGKIIMNGICNIAGVVKENNLMTLDDTYIDGCQLCKDIFSKEHVTEELKKLLG